MKSKRGVPSAAQRRVLTELHAVGAVVFLARNAAAPLEALRRSNVSFRRPWGPSTPITDWEGPFEFADPHLRLPQAPEAKAKRRAATQRWRERRRRAREAEKLAGADIAA